MPLEQTEHTPSQQAVSTGGKLAHALLPQGFYRRVRAVHNSFHNTVSMVSRDNSLVRFFQHYVQRRKPRLFHLEIHLTDHCNLNCKGCGHFCNIAPEFFLSPEAFRDEMQKVAAYFSEVEELYLLGGEPLLHKQLADIVLNARNFVPIRRLVVLSNGILVTHLGEKEWQALHQAQAQLSISEYPLNLPREQIEELGRTHDVPIIWEGPITRFFVAPLVKEGTADPYDSFEACQGYSACPILRDGALYHCAAAAYDDILRTQFSLKGSVFKTRDEDRFILKRQPRLRDAWAALNFLRACSPFCRFCDFTHFTWYDWGHSHKRLSEWTLRPEDDAQ